MYGYVTPVKDKLRKQDYVLFRAFYCGVCVETGKAFGALARYATSYDAAFLAALVHDAANQTVEFEVSGCVGNPFTKKAMVKHNPLLERVAAANVLLAYYKLLDDVIDGGGAKKRVACRAIRKPYLKAKALLPKVDAIIAARYDELREKEKSGEKSVDRAADSFACMLRETVNAIMDGKTDDNLGGLCYNIGKFVYLIDALDDVADDAKSGNYNPFIAAYGDFTGRREFFEAHAADIGFIINSTVNRAIECFNGMRFTQSYTLLKNVVYDGLRSKAAEVLGADKKIPKPKI